MIEKNQINEIKVRLEQEALLSHAPVTGYAVACAIITEENTYYGHNYEHENPTVFEHAEMRTLEEVLKYESNPKIKQVVMFGSRKVPKFKSYIPCFICSQRLQQYTDETTQVYLFPLSGSTQDLSVTFDEIMESYQDLPYSQIEKGSLGHIKKELISKTILHDRELDFVTDLAHLTQTNNLGLFLTGSASGRGGVSRLILLKTERSYDDLDLIIVTEDDKSDIESRIEELLVKNYGRFQKEIKSVPEHRNLNKVVYRNIYYYCGKEKEQLIDISFSKEFKSSFNHRPYELKNWFHQLS